MTRRRYGDGSVYQRSSDGRWFGAVDAGYTRSGKRRRRTVSAATQPEVRRKLRDLIRRLETEGETGVDLKATVKTYAEAWLTRAEARSRPSTFATTRVAIEAWVIPTIGHRRLAQVEPADVRAVAEAVTAAGLKTSTARRYNAALTALLKDAILDGYPIPQRVLLTERPSLGVSDRRAMTTSEALLVLAEAATLPHGSRWALALLQGMRQGEALGLTWDAVDLTEQALRVEWQLQPLRYRDPERKRLGFRIPPNYEARHVDGAFHLVRPKTRQGYRIIPLVPWAANALEAWRDVAPTNKHGLVWPTPTGRPRSARTDAAEWHALQASAGVMHPSGRPYHVHEARHSTATLLMELGVPESVRVAIMGHSSITTTHGYEHVDTSTARVALEQVAARLQLAPAAIEGGET